MATYVSTIKFTPQGMQGIHETCQRAAAFKSMAKKLKIKIHSMLWALGPFDGFLLFDAEDDTVATAAMLHLASLGNVQTTTCRAFDVPEMEKIVAAMPMPR